MLALEQFGSIVTANWFDCSIETDKHLIRKKGTISKVKNDMSHAYEKSYSHLIDLHCIALCFKELSRAFGSFHLLLDSIGKVEFLSGIQKKLKALEISS